MASDTVKLRSYLPKYRKNLLSVSLESSNCILKIEAAYKSRLHGVTAYKTVICIVITLRSLYPYWSVTATSALCFDDSDCRSLQSSRCFIVDDSEGTCMCNEGYSSSEDTRKCVPGKGQVNALQVLGFAGIKGANTERFSRNIQIFQYQYRHSRKKQRHDLSLTQ